MRKFSVTYMTLGFVISRFTIWGFAVLSLYAFDLHLWYTRLEWSEVLQWKPILEYLKLGIAGGTMNVLDIGISELQAVVVLYFGVVPMNAFTTLKHLTSIATTACKSIGIGYSIRVGHCLGELQAQRAKIVFVVGLVIVFGTVSQQNNLFY